MEAYPLYWPDGYKRTKWKSSSRFSTEFGKARYNLFHELELMDAKRVILSTNIPLRRDGLPYADTRKIDDPGVAVYFELKGKRVVLACDCWNSVAANIHAVALTVGAMRGIDRWGVSEVLERAFTGFTALPAPQSPFEILGVPPTATREEIREARNRLALKHHPDIDPQAGDAMARINKAFDDAMRQWG